MRFEGLPVVDATESLTVDIGPHHIRGGRSRKPHDCAVNRAAEARSDVVEARIGARTGFIRYRSDPDVWIRYRLTPRGIKMVRYFDSDESAVKVAAAWMDTSSIDLKAPSPSRRLGKIHSQKRTGTQKGKTPEINRRESLRHVTVKGD